MIKFFRHIRQGLLNENKFKKYLLYAVGEIILVVIGILIAVQINGWKIQADNRNLETAILKNIKRDLNDDINNLKEVASFKAEQREACLRLKKLFVDTSIEVVDSVQFFKDVTRLIYFILPSANNTAFETAKSNGYITIIANDSLVEHVSKYYSDITLDQHVTETKRFTNAFAESVLMKKYLIFSRYTLALDGIGGTYILEGYDNDDRVPFSIDEYRRNLEIENYLNSFSIRLKIGINYLKKKENEAAQLISQINQELEKGA